MRWWLSLAARLYPKLWRERYGAEFACLLDDVELRWTDLVDVLRGAAMMQVKTWSSYLKLVGAVAVAGAIVAIGVSFIWPNWYMSSAVIRADRAEDPYVVNQIHDAFTQAVSRASLSEMIQRPNLDLYRSERQREPLEDVIEEMKQSLRIQQLKDGDTAVFRVDFLYGDRFKAQGVVDALTKKVLGVDRARWQAGPASLPEAPIKRNRLVFMGWGLGAGLLIGVVVSLLRWRTRWTIVVAGFGLAGCAIAAGLSLLLPNWYTSRAMLRVIPAPKADGAQRYMQEPEMADWLRKKGREILSDESLSDIIQRPRLDLYHKQREQQSLKTVIAAMRKDLRIDAPHSRSEFTISFTYPDRFKAQAVLSALITKFTESEIVITEADLMAYHPPARRAVEDCIGKTADAYVDCITAYLGPIFPAAEALRRRKGAESIDVLDAASLPETPVAPDSRGSRTVCRAVSRRLRVAKEAVADSETRMTAAEVSYQPACSPLFCSSSHFWSGAK